MALSGLLSWELDLWGGIRRNNQAARANLLEAQYQRDAVQTRLIAAVASAYIDLQTSMNASPFRAAPPKPQGVARSGHRPQERWHQLGSGGRPGRGLALPSAGTIPVTERGIADKENEIRALLGEYPGGITRGGSLDRLDASLHIAGGLPSSLMQRRP